MTEEQINEVKERINTRLRDGCSTYLYERLDPHTLASVEAYVHAMLTDFSREWPVLRELKPRVWVNNVNSLCILFDHTTERSEKFLRGEAFIG